MFDDIHETSADETQALRGGDTFERPFTGGELLAEAGLPIRAIREILGDTPCAGAYGRME